MKKSLVIESMFADKPLIERIKLAADNGFDGVEYWDCAKDNAKELGAEAAARGVEVTGCIAKGLFASHLNRSFKAVEKTFLESLPYMKRLRCKNLVMFPSNTIKNIDSQKCLIIENLKKLAPLAANEGVVIFLEPVNSIVDHIGHYLDNSVIASEIVRCVDHINVRINYDIYHMQIMEGNIINNITNNIDIIAHFHSAGVPGRNEHFLGELNYPNIIKCIQELGFNGYFGLEYFPTYDNQKSIKDVLKYLCI